MGAAANLRERTTMTFTKMMIATTLAAVAATGAFAQDAMKKDDKMAAHDAMATDKMAPHDAMATDHMAADKKMTPAEKKKHDAMVKKDAMAHDAMKTSTPK
jgi:pentapeptide MXKDX repeat protein